ncbi:MAG: hypothetical protein JWN96_4134 [Mycobacterium sp.]|nr:hypothetical protein [Mycobacterium sp.]
MTGTLSPSILGQAEKSHSAVLYRTLAGTDVDEIQWITLVLAVGAVSAVDRAQHVAYVASTARFATDDVNAAIDRLLQKSLLVAEDQRLIVGPAGVAFVDRVRAETGPVVSRAYAGISADELAITARVLTEITSRLSAELDQPAD